MMLKIQLCIRGINDNLTYIQIENMYPTFLTVLLFYCTFEVNAVLVRIREFFLKKMFYNICIKICNLNGMIFMII